MRRNGFTLIELLVVVAIIAILSAILFPVFAKVREKARTTTCQSNLKQYALAITMYFDDYDDYGPFISCGSQVARKLEGGRCPEGVNSTGSCGIYSCPKGPYSLPYYRGGNCHAGPPSIKTPWSRDSHPTGGRVIHPASVMLVGDARAGHQWINTPAWFYDLDGDGMMTPRHGNLNNMAFCDGHVKGFTPGFLKEQVDAGSADANGDGRADGWDTGKGAWWFWYF